MRLTDSQQQHIREAVIGIFGTTADVYLFGSRVNDQNRGGDIDLYLEIDPVEGWFMRRIALAVELEKRLGEQKIDLVLYRRDQEKKAIHFIAKDTGVKL
ncbi:MAG: nucleotidyltransferase domain-containing protein [Mariprofundaceae bacterium]|nr:nucleotidyltransferase domain-containing protein [Mariprofundaceae bacterium]